MLVFLLKITSKRVLIDIKKEIKKESKIAMWAKIPQIAYNMSHESCRLCQQSKRFLRAGFEPAT